MKKPAVFLTTPKRFHNFSSLLELRPQEVSCFLNSASPQKESKENFEISELLKNAPFLSPAEIRKIQKNSYFPDFRLILECDLPRFSSQERFGEEESFIFLPGYSRPIPFCEIPAGQALWTQIQRLPFESKAEDLQRPESRRKKELRKFLIRFLKVTREMATPKQWQIARRIFINEYYQQGQVSLKDMAKELNIPPSTFIQQLWGRPRNGKWVGGLFPKVAKKIRKNTNVLALIRKEKRLLQIILKNY